MLKSKRFWAFLLAAVMMVQLLPVLSAPAKAIAEGDFSTAEMVVGGSFNGEGVWITEIHDNDVERNSATNDREATGYQSIHLYDTGSDLMEFVEVISTFDEDIRFNDLYELYNDSKKLTVTTVDGSSNVVLKRGQPTVLWNYRTDVTVTLPTEAEFREDLRIPEDALVLKVQGTYGWSSNATFSLKSKQTGKTVCSFETVNETNVRDGYSVELKVPMEGSALEVYRNLTLPSPGHVYAPQVRYLIPARAPEGFEGKGVYISEIRANDINRSGTYGASGDQMECIEIVNTTDKAVDLNKDYKVTYTIREGHRKILKLYKYSSGASGYMGSSTGCTVPAGGTAVLWCFRYSFDAALTSVPTEAQLRSAYGISSGTPVYIFTNQNSMSDTNRSIELFEADGDGLGRLVSAYSYLGGTDLSDGKSVHLKINPEGPEMLIHAANATTTMGTVDAAQLKYVKDYGDVVWMHLAEGSSVPEYVVQGQHLRVNFWYDFNGRTARTATDTYYRFDGTGSWIKATEGGIRIPNLYELFIPAYELFEHEYVEFYVINSNTLRDTIMGIYKVPIRKLNAVAGIRTNITDGEAVRGTVSVTANDGGTNSATKIYIDGTQYTTTPMMEDGAYFSYVVDGLGGFGMNELTNTKNERIAHVGNFMFEVPVRQLVHIENHRFSYSSSKYNVTLRFWAGTGGTAGEDKYGPSGSRDDYSITELQLKLPNGKTYLPTSIGPSRYNGVDTSSKTNLSTALSAVHWVGDSSKTSPYLDVKFSIPASEVNAVGINLDTTKLFEGIHTLKVTNGTSSKTLTFIVDNTAPALDLGISNGASVTGNISIDPRVTEANGLGSLVTLLDGEVIDTPCTVTAHALGEGSHTLEATVTDVAGNSTTKKISFNVGSIAMSVTDAGTTDVSGTTARLYLTAKSDASTDVTFYKAEKIEAARIQTQMVSGVVPYLRYTIDVGDAAADDEIVVSWNGTASGVDGTRACSMFVRNVVTDRWLPVGKADATGTITNASFRVQDHVQEGKAEVIVQCTYGSSLPDTDTVNDGITGNNSGWDGKSAPKDYDFAFAWISDTQGYVQRYNHHYINMNKWMVENRDSWKIRYVIHTGDLVDDPDAVYMWENADEAMKILDDAGMPYGVLAGNHDVYAGIDDRTEYYQWFPEDRVKHQPTFGGSYENNYGHYDLVSENGQDFIIVYMSWNIYEDEIDWMNEVLARYSDRKAILCFHGYTHVKESMDGYLDYFGVMIRDHVVAKNPNVFAVLSGHYSGASYQTSRFDDNGDGKLDRTVYQICTDYQSVSQGGLEYIKFLYFDLDNDKVFVNSYSPYMDDFNYFDTNTADNLNTLAKGASGGEVNKTNVDSMILELNFDIKQQSITENSFNAAVYTDEVLGSAVLNGGTAQLQASGLTADTKQAWYAVLENENSGCLRTDAYEFTTGHDYVAVVTPATCTEGGYTTYTCSGCGHSYRGNVTSAKGHSYHSVVTAPTCTEGGYTTYTCSGCGYSYQGDVTSAKGHSYRSVVTAPTCTDDGYTTYTCSGCGHSYRGNVTSAKGHSYHSVVTAPTCTEGGYTTYTCSGCGHSYQGDVTSVKDHSYHSVVTAPTCTEGGYTTYTCSGCGYSYQGDVTSAKGHSYQSVVTAPTCTDGGYTTHTCTACGDRYTDAQTPATGHSFSYGICTGCGYQDPDYVEGYYLFGYINGSNYACEEDRENMGIYKFVDGRLTVKFTQDSYVAVKTGGNRAWYMTEGWQGEEVTSVTLYPTDTLFAADKLFVPGNVEVTFTLTDNGDGSLTLSYEKPLVAVRPTLALKYPTLTFEDVITMNVFFQAENLQDVVEMGLITYKSEVSEWNVDNAETVVPGYKLDPSGFYTASTLGIPAKDMGDTYWFAVYAKLTDGTYTYTRLVSYSPTTYAYNQLSDPTMSKLVVAMLNYGAAAQVYFDYRTDDLMNKNLTPAQQASIESYRADMMAPVVNADSAKVGIIADNGGFSRRYPTITFDGAFCIDYFFTPAKTPSGNVSLYYWTQDAYDNASTLTTANASGRLTMIPDGTGAYQATIEGIAAKDLDKTVYVSADYASSGTSCCSGVLAYSIGAYCVSQAASTDTMSPFAKATAVYGYYAKQTFN